MRIAILTPFYYPNFGGVAAIVEILAAGLAARGHGVRIVGRTPADPERDNRGAVPDAVEVVNGARPADAAAAMQWADVGVLIGSALGFGIPAVVSRKPFLISHHYWYHRNPSLKETPVRVARSWLLNQAPSSACSAAVARDLPVPSKVLLNGFRTDIHKAPPPGAARDIDILFVGRIEPPKGVDTLIAAVAMMKTPASVDLVGPDEMGVQQLFARSGIEHRIRYHGPQPPHRCAEMMAQAKILAVPSHAEPFGLVALEGIAQGCAVIASSGSGLTEAVGEAGLLVPPKEPAAWAAALDRLLADPEERAALAAKGPKHLRIFSPELMVERYLETLQVVRAQWKTTRFKPDILKASPEPLAIASRNQAA